MRLDAVKRRTDGATPRQGRAHAHREGDTERDGDGQREGEGATRSPPQPALGILAMRLDALEQRAEQSADVLDCVLHKARPLTYVCIRVYLCVRK